MLKNVCLKKIECYCRLSPPDFKTELKTNFQAI